MRYRIDSRTSPDGRGRGAWVGSTAGGAALGLALAILVIVAPDALLWRTLAGGVLVVAMAALGWWVGDAMGELRSQATTDPLTGLANRRPFERSLDQELARADRQGTPLSLLMVDIDRLKSINDRAGHAAGDEVIQRVSETLRRQARLTDVAARLGGDEFAILLPGTSVGEALEVGARLRRSLDVGPTLANPRRPSVTVSVGVAGVDGGRRRVAPATLLRAADTALYRAKAAGRDQCVAFAGSTPGGGWSPFWEVATSPSAGTGGNPPPVHIEA